MGSEEKLGLGPSIETITKAAALGLGLLYVFGLLVVTTYLAQYGVSLPGLVQVQYIVAGVLLITPLCLTYFLIALIIYDHTQVSVPSKPQVRGAMRRIMGISWRIAAGIIVWAAVVEVALPLYVTIPTNGLTHLSSLRPHLNLFVMPIILACLAYYSWVGWWSFFQVRPFMPWNIKTVAIPFVASAFCLFYFLAYISYFSTNIYPQIPHELGGGKPLSVIFLLKSNEGQSLQPLTSDASGRRSIPYKLLIETDSAYVVLSTDTKEFVLRINKDAVNGYSVLREP
jgi:hypothetical protein